MTTILLVILGVLLAAAAALFVVYYGGDAFGNGHIEAEAGRLVGEGSQMEAALELYYRQEGHYPRGDDPVAELIAAGYLDHEPLGTRTTEADRWAINYEAGMIMARLGATDHEETTSICLKARQQLDLPTANTSTGIYRCDGTDSPGGRLAGREPCCIGGVGVGGGPAEDVIDPVTGDPFTDSQYAYLMTELAKMEATDPYELALDSANGGYRAEINPEYGIDMVYKGDRPYIRLDTNRRNLRNQICVNIRNKDGWSGATSPSKEQYDCEYYETRIMGRLSQADQYRSAQNEYIKAQLEKMRKTDPYQLSATGAGIVPSSDDHYYGNGYVYSGDYAIIRMGGTNSNDYRGYLCEWLGGRDSMWAIYHSSGNPAPGGYGCRHYYNDAIVEIDDTDAFRSAQLNYVSNQLDQMVASGGSYIPAIDTRFAVNASYSSDGSRAYIGLRTNDDARYKTYLCEWIQDHPQAGWKVYHSSGSPDAGGYACAHYYDRVEALM